MQNFNFFQSDKEKGNAEFSIIKPNLLNLDLEESDSASNATAVSTIIENLFLPNEIYSQMNEGQQHLFNFVVQYALHCKLAEKNNELPTKLFQIFLRGGNGIGKSFLIKVVTEYLKLVLRYPNQNLDQPSVLVTVFTGKAATGMNGLTLHSLFHLPVKYKKPSDETLHMLRSSYQYLKVLIIDEILMIGRETFGHLDIALKAIMQNSLPFGGVSLLVVGQFLQLSPINQKGVLMELSKGSYRSFNRWLWENFQLHELAEIVRQSRGFKKGSKQIMMCFK